MREIWEVFLCTFWLRGRLKLVEIWVQTFSENLCQQQAAVVGICHQYYRFWLCPGPRKIPGRISDAAHKTFCPYFW
jgi:hypothetical protein